MGKQILAVLIMLTGSVAAIADTTTPGTYQMLDQKYQIYLGGFFPEVESTISINGNVLPPQPGIDFEKVLGIESSKNVVWGGARWRISRRNSLELEFFSLNRSGSTAIATDPLEIGDSIVQAGAQVDTTVDLSLGRLTYGYSLYRSERADFQLKAGLHLLDTSVALQATGAVCVDGETPPNCSVFESTPRTESEDVTAPLPHLGLSFGYGITPSVALRLQTIGFAVEIDNIDGSIIEVDADVLWQPWEHVGFGAGVRYFEVKVSAEDSGFNGEYEFNYLGPVIYATASF